jgi:outer membrane protein assembly factor BamE (lipoprotein component of BamABCDE complex)
MTTRQLFVYTVVVAAVLAAAFYIMDEWRLRSVEVGMSIAQVRDRLGRPSMVVDTAHIARFSFGCRKDKVNEPAPVSCTG